MSKSTFYLLDSSAIISISHINSGATNLTDDMKDRQQKLLSIDKKGNFISGMLAVMEGQASQEETPEQKKATVTKIGNTLDTFFKNAETDANALQATSENLSQLSLGTHERSYTDAAKFRDTVFFDLVQLPKKKDIAAFEDKLIRIARENDLQPSHPIVLCAISALYGKDETRNVLKVSKEKDKGNSYNALSDVYAVSRIPMLSNLIYSEFPNYDIEFITFDKGLEFFYESLVPTSVIEINRRDRSDVAITVSVSRDLFPGITDKHFNVLAKKIHGG